MAAIPILFIFFRGVAGPLILLLQTRHAPGMVLAALIILAVLSDIFDGIIARRLGTDTPLLRRSDSIVDLVFWICVGFAAWRGFRADFLAHLLPIIVVALLDLLRIVFDFFKFRTYSGYHTWLSKAWALLLMATMVAMLGFGHAGLLPAAIYFGIVCELENGLVSLLLPRAHVDVHTLWHAWQMRQADLAAQRGTETVSAGDTAA